MSLSIGCLQLVLSRGQRLDWFDSTEIVFETFLGALAFYLFISHSLTASRPFLNLKLLLDRNYAIGLLLVTIFGMLNFTPMVLLPSLLRQHVGFPDSLIGIVLSSRGLGAMVGFFLGGMLGRRYPRKCMLLGFGLQVASGLWLMSLNLDLGLGALLGNGLMQGIAVGTIWVPMTVVTFSTLKPEHLAETSAVYHLLRNIGSSVFISLCVAEIVRSTGINYAQLSGLITPYNQMLSLPWVAGGWGMETLPELARLSKEISRQAAMISYLNAFGMYTAVSAAAIPLILLVARPGKGGGTQVTG